MQLRAGNEVPTDESGSNINKLKRISGIYIYIYIYMKKR